MPWGTLPINYLQKVYSVSQVRDIKNSGFVAAELLQDPVSKTLILKITDENIRLLLLTIPVYRMGTLPIHQLKGSSCQPRKSEILTSLI